MTITVLLKKKTASSLHLRRKIGIPDQPVVLAALPAIAAGSSAVS
ncbi:MAG: hypothetical protein AAFR90_05415 [Pseudomonadota bacterium]